MHVNPRLAEQPQALTFFVAGQEYAIGILTVKEIIEYETPTRVPSSPPCVAGVINLRGTVVPVVDLALRFRLVPAAVTSRTCIVIVEVTIDEQTVVMGILADAVNAVIELTPGEIDKPPQFGTSVRAGDLLGMIRSGSKFVLLLDIERVLAGIDAPATTDVVPSIVRTAALEVA
jgi:purine-binding chemotaxis protein CheW